ncbi:hypothetical protein LTR17_012563 [Elasticomyces elasticus]|nr:hypothetical protein LTR17_012563 [Elasticomyces elasticus]
MKLAVVTLALVAAANAVENCSDYYNYALEPHGPFSGGVYNLSYMRPDPICRTFNSSIVESTLESVSQDITDPDLRRLFSNAFPSTLDTAIKWKGYADESDEELTFVITGDVYRHFPLYNGRLHADVDFEDQRYVATRLCKSDAIIPASPDCRQLIQFLSIAIPSVFECKYELDSLAAFLEVSTDYYNATQDATFFKKYNWVQTIESILEVAENMTVPTYQADGNVSVLSYSFTRLTTRSSETTENDGLGNPFNNGTGLIRSFFRPSDDSTIFQGFIPANMMFSRFLETSAAIADAIGESDLCNRMTTMAGNVRTAITNYGIVETAAYGRIYAFEVDGYMGQNIMDDANIPSLLSAPFLGYLDVNDEVYQNTRKLLLSANNPYFMRGPQISAIGGAHDGPGYAWPMASIVRILTSEDDAEITQQLQEIVSTTDGLGLIHESINTFNTSDWTRQWFSWANGLFGQMILDLNDRKPELLKQSFQGNESVGYSG